MKKVLLRKLTVNDVDDLLLIARNPDVTRYIPGMIQDRETFMSWINGLRDSDHEYMVLKATDADQKVFDGNANNTTKVNGSTEDIIIGECSLDGSGEIGLMLLPEYWRQGYGTATITELIRIATSLGMEKITVQTSSENTACVGLFRSMGFTASGMGWIIPEEEMLNEDEVMPNADDIVPNADEAMPNADDAVPNADEAMPNADDAVPNADEVMPNADDTVPNAVEVLSDPLKPLIILSKNLKEASQ